LSVSAQIRQDSHLSFFKRNAYFQWRRACLNSARRSIARAAWRRAARYGDGWYGFHTDPEAKKRSLDWIRGYIENGERPSELGDLEISVTPPIPISKEVIRQYEDIGVHRLIPWLNAPTLDDALLGRVMNYDPCEYNNSHLGMRRQSQARA